MSQCLQQRTGLLSLPTEVLDHIIHLLSQDLSPPSPISVNAAFSLTKDPHGINRDRRKRSTLSRLCQTCKSLAAITTPHLYSSITLARHQRFCSVSPDGDAGTIQRFEADSLVLVLRILVEGGDRLRGCVRDVRSFLILRQAHAYRQAFWPIHDPSIIAQSWQRLASTIKVPHEDKLVTRVLGSCGLLQDDEESHAENYGEHARQAPKRVIISPDSILCLPERILAAILLLCHSVRSITLVCPPWDTQIPSIHARYRVLDQIIDDAVHGSDTSATNFSTTTQVLTPPGSLPRQPLSRLEAVTFTNMHGLGRSPPHELYAHDGFCRGYLARGDSCPALARVPSVTEVSSHGALGGWDEWLARGTEAGPEQGHISRPASPLPVRSDSSHFQGQETPDISLAKGSSQSRTMNYKRLHIGSAALNPALTAMLPPQHDTGNGSRVPPDTIEQLVLFQSTIHDAPLRRSGDTASALDITLCDNVLARHARSLRMLDMMTCWDLEVSNPSAESQAVEGLQADSGLPRPLRSLAFLENLQTLRISLPLLATNRDLWRFYGMLPQDIISTSRRSCQIAADTFASVKGPHHHPHDQQQQQQQQVNHDNYQPSSSTALTRADIPFLRCLPRSLRHLCIADYYFIPNSPYWRRRGKYGSGDGIPSFESYKDADAAAAIREASGGRSWSGSSGRGSSSSAASTDESSCSSDDDDDYGADGIGGADGWTYANTAPSPPSLSSNVTARTNSASSTSPFPSPPLSTPSHSSTDSDDDEGSMREYTHKYLLPLALRRLAGVCSHTHPHLESVVVDTMPMLRYQCMPAVSEGHGYGGVPIDWLVRGGGEIRDMFAREGVAFEGVFDVEGAGKMGFVAR